MEMIQIDIQLFAGLVSLAGGNRIFTLETERGSGLTAIRDAVKNRFPGIAGLLDRSRAAVEDEFIPDSWTIDKDSTICFLPPVSGG